MVFSSYAEILATTSPAMGCSGDVIYRLGSGLAYSRSSIRDRERKKMRIGDSQREKMLHDMKLGQGEEKTGIEAI
jgi:hypothetical protein